MKRIQIGCSGWHYKEWKGKFYPKNTSPRECLSYYATFFKAVEVNSTFYQFPSSHIIESWYQATPEDFRFSLKAHRAITHNKKFNQVSELLKRFYASADMLREKLACCLFQFPASFIYKEERLLHILAQLDPRYINVLEFRHSSWWKEQVFKMVESYNVLFCTSSGFSLPEDLVVLKGNAYIRFHGDPTYSVSYPDEELLYWRDKIAAACS